MSDYFLFPTDITLEILQRLPVKSLIRFTAVCKSWRSLITGPSFISSHLSVANTRSTHLIRRYDSVNKTEQYSLLESTENGIVTSSKIDFPLKSNFGYFRIIGSCNGIMCLTDDHIQTVPHPIIFLNPTIRKSITLPEPVIKPKEPHSFVLGFGGAGDDTKIVRLIYFRKSDGNGFEANPQAEIYSLKKRSWRRLEGVNINLQIIEYIWHQALLNEVVHWIAYKPVRINRTSSILTFNFAKEDFGEVLLPNELSRKFVYNQSVSTALGSLVVISCTTGFEGETVKMESIDVWIMKEYSLKETWMKLYRITMFDIRRVVALWSKTEALGVSRDNELVCYDSESGQVKKLGISGTACAFYIDGFVESMVLFGRGGVVE